VASAVALAAVVVATVALGSNGGEAASGPREAGCLDAPPPPALRVRQPRPLGRRSGQILLGDGAPPGHRHLESPRAGSEAVARLDTQTPEGTSNLVAIVERARGGTAGCGCASGSPCCPTT
jgi:hypothetical protein